MYQLVNTITCEIIDPASHNSVCGLFLGRVSDEFVFGSPSPTFKVAEVNTVYQLVNTITCDILNSASPNSVCGFFMGVSQMSLHLGHLDLLSRLLRSAVHVCISL